MTDSVETGDMAISDGRQEGWSVAESASSRWGAYFKGIEARLLLGTGIVILVLQGAMIAGLLYGFSVFNADQDARAQLYRDLNSSLRQQVFKLQNDYQAIPERLEVDPLKAVAAYLESHSYETYEYPTRDDWASLLGRSGRRDVGKRGTPVVRENSGKPSIFVGQFDDEGNFTEVVLEHRLESGDASTVEQEIRDIVAASSGPDALANQVLILKNYLADANLEADNVRNQITYAVDEITAAENEIDTLTKWMRHGILIGSGVTLVVLILGTSLIGRMLITKPLTRLTRTAKQVTDGEEVEVPDLERVDELGTLARRIEQFRVALAENIALRREREQDHAIHMERVRSREAAIENFGTTIEKIVRDLSAASRELKGQADDLEASVESTANQAGVASSSAEAAAQGGERISAASVELEQAVRLISENVEQSKAAAGSAVEQAEEADKIIARLSDTTDAIGRVADFINDVAEQTNLLALNATIEASRAGEHGRGFAVVASEVKNLATQTRNATDQIAQQIRDIRGVANETIQRFKMIGERIEELDRGSRDIDDAVDAQARVSAGISDSARTADEQVRSALRAVQEVSGLADRNRDVASNVTSASARIEQTSQRLAASLDELVAALGKT